MLKSTNDYIRHFIESVIVVINSKFSRRPLSNFGHVWKWKSSCQIISSLSQLLMLRVLCIFTVLHTAHIPLDLLIKYFQKAKTSIP